jgi:hypothetical protein
MTRLFCQFWGNNLPQHPLLPFFGCLREYADDPIANVKWQIEEHTAPLLAWFDRVITNIRTMDDGFNRPPPPQVMEPPSTIPLACTISDNIIISLRLHLHL